MESVMKKITLAVVLSTALATPAMANETPETGLIDAQQVFHMEDTQPMQLAMLSEQEMRETEGAVLPAWAAWSFVNAGWGALGGGVGYATSTLTSGSQWSWSALGGSMAGGAVGGAFKNPGLSATFGAGVGGAISGWFSQ